MTAHMRLGFHTPETEEELSQLVLEAAESRTPLEVMGKGTKRELGHAVRAGAVVSTENMRGITLYEPTELVMVAKTGTPLAEIEAALAENDQELACEPVDIAPVMGYGPGEGTVGGLVATNISGSRRILKGAVRDQVLGIRAVNGRGEIIKSGGRVMKNVTMSVATPNRMDCDRSHSVASPRVPQAPRSRKCSGGWTSLSATAIASPGPLREAHHV